MWKKKEDKPAKKLAAVKTVGKKARSARKSSIRVKIALSIGCMVILVSVLINSIAIYAIRQSTYNALAISMSNAADIAANVVSKELEARITEMENISDQVNTIASKYLKRVKIDLLVEEAGYEFLGMADETGLLAGEGETTNVAGEEFLSRAAILWSHLSVMSSSPMIKPRRR